MVPRCRSHRGNYVVRKDRVWCNRSVSGTLLTYTIMIRSAAEVEYRCSSFLHSAVMKIYTARGGDFGLEKQKHLLPLMFFYK